MLSLNYFKNKIVKNSVTLNKVINNNYYQKIQ